ncbi:TetR/AcrR family transcriptional regulator [Terrabacter sp. GCM10028922]|uniref:TetR/AcrR family transcriptional regulator n=1 Tax=Terrabacter sp. GCM10028922 TaxID=3273428 RepID=UPI00361C3DE2
MKSEGGQGGRGYVMRERARSTAETGERILDATAALFLEVPYPQLTLASVAARAGVTVQTVIRRFGDKEGLVAAAAARGTDAVRAQRMTAPIGDLPGIVDNVVEHYETTGDVALRLLAEEESSPTIGDITARARALHREWCAHVFAPQLSGLTGVEHDRRLAQFVAVCDVYTWKLLRRDAGLSRRQLTTALLELLEPFTTER